MQAASRAWQRSARVRSAAHARGAAGGVGAQCIGHRMPRTFEGWLLPVRAACRRHHHGSGGELSAILRKCVGDRHERRLQRRRGRWHALDSEREWDRAAALGGWRMLPAARRRGGSSRTSGALPAGCWVHGRWAVMTGCSCGSGDGPGRRNGARGRYLFETSSTSSRRHAPLRDVTLADDEEVTRMQLSSGPSTEPTEGSNPWCVRAQ